MQDQDQPKKNTNNQIMDVAPAPVPAPENETENKSDVVASDNSGSEEETTASDVSDKSSSSPNDNNLSPVNDGHLPAPALPTGHKAGGPIIAIVAAIIVALGLAGVTVYAYMKMQNENKPSSSQINPVENQPASAKVDEIGDASKTVDDAINSSDGNEFNSSELSDQSLGL